MVNSRDKGARGEREAAAELNSIFGTSARRGQQYKGSPESPDVAEFIDGVHIEVKRVERFNLYDALEQAERDSGPLDVPVVMHRKSRKDWVFVVKTRDMLRFMDMYDEARKKSLEEGKPQED
jgi:hypothetical protein